MSAPSARHGSSRPRHVASAVRIGVACSVAAVSLTGFLQPAAAATTTDSVLSATGSALEVRSSIPDPGDLTASYPIVARSSSSSAMVDTGAFAPAGLNPVQGDVLAIASAAGARADVPDRPAGAQKQLAHARYALADHHFPSTEPGPDTASAVDQVTVEGVLTASALSSSAQSAGGPTASSSSTAGQVDLLPGAGVGDGARPALDIQLLQGTSEASTTTAKGTGDVGSVVLAPDATPLGVGIEVSLPKVSATATLPTTGSPTTAMTCTGLEVTVTFPDPIGPLPAPDPLNLTGCDSANDLVLPPAPLPPLLKLEFGKTTSSSGPDAASLRIAALTLTVGALPGGEPTVIELATASASAARVVRMTPEVAATCPGAPAPSAPVSSGSAEGTVATLEALDLVRADVARSKADYASALLPFVDGDTARGPSSTRAFGQPVALHALPGPAGPALVDSGTVVTLGDSLGADVPAPGQQPAETAELLNEDTGLVIPVTSGTDGMVTLQGTQISSSATADAAGRSAAADSRYVGLAGEIGLPGAGDTLTASTDDVVSSASTSRSGTVVTSTSAVTLSDTEGTSPTAATYGIAGADVQLTALQTEGTQAVAGGTPGSASATEGSTTLLELTVNGQVLDPSAVAVDGTVTYSSSGTVDIIDDVVRVTTGRSTKVVAADGTSASVEVVPVLIEVLDPDDDTTVLASLTLGRTAARAATTAPAAAGSAFVSTTVEQHFEGTAFDDLGAIISPHQKYYYRVCVANTGSSPITGATLTIPSNPDIFVVDPLEFTSAATYASSALVKSGISLAPGAFDSFDAFVEINEAVTAVPKNVTVVPTLAGGTVATLVSGAPATVIAGYTTEHPALSVVKVSQSFNSTTRVLTLKRKVLNDSRAGAATGVIIDKITPLSGETILTGVPLNPCPLMVTGCSLAPGQMSPEFTVLIKVPAGQNTFRIDYREAAKDTAGRAYRFD